MNPTSLTVLLGVLVLMQVVVLVGERVALRAARRQRAADEAYLLHMKLIRRAMFGPAQDEARTPLPPPLPTQEPGPMLEPGPRREDKPPRCDDAANRIPVSPPRYDEVRW